MNSIVVIGKVSRAPQAVNANAKSFSVFTVEDTNAFKKYPDYVKVLCFGKLQEQIGFGEGSIVAVTGRAQCEGYLGKKDNKPKAALSVVARDIEIIACVAAVPAEDTGAPTVDASDVPPVEPDSVPF